VTCALRAAWIDHHFAAHDLGQRIAVPADLVEDLVLGADDGRGIAARQGSRLSLGAIDIIGDDIPSASIASDITR